MHRVAFFSVGDGGCGMGMADEVSLVVLVYVCVWLELLNVKVG